jgi:hypothetical protein
VLRAADVLLVPLIPATLSLRTYAQLTRFVADAPRPRPQVVAFFSIADRRKRLHREVIDAIPATVAGSPTPSSRRPVDGTHRADGRAPRAGPRLRTDEQGSQVLRARSWGLTSGFKPRIRTG